MIVKLIEPKAPQLTFTDVLCGESFVFRTYRGDELWTKHNAVYSMSHKATRLADGATCLFLPDDPVVRIVYGVQEVQK